MPRRDWLFRIHDILEAIEASRGFTDGLDEAAFAGDDKTRRAVLHVLIVIGEAAAHVPEEMCLRHPAVDWARMRAMRNVLVHEYFGVDSAIVWRTVQDELPALARKLRALLAEHTPEA